MHRIIILTEEEAQMFLPGNCRAHHLPVVVVAAQHGIQEPVHVNLLVPRELHGLAGIVCKIRLVHLIVVEVIVDLHVSLRVAGAAQINTGIIPHVCVVSQEAILHHVRIRQEDVKVENIGTTVAVHANHQVLALGQQEHMRHPGHRRLQPRVHQVHQDLVLNLHQDMGVVHQDNTGMAVHV